MITRGKTPQKPKSAQATDAGANPHAGLPEPNEYERSAINNAIDSTLNRRPRVRAKIETDGDVLSIGSRHRDEYGTAARLLDAFGTSSQEFTAKAISQLASVVKQKGAKHPTEMELNSALAAIDGLGPRDEIEAMLAMQMVATHDLAMNMLAQAKQAQFMPSLENYGSLAVRLMRTYTAQIEALAKFRRGGEQTVRVEHVHVYPGGQAVVGNVDHQQTAGGGRGSENVSQPHAPDDARAPALASGSPMWSADAERDTMLLAGGEGQETVPDARRRKR